MNNQISYAGDFVSFFIIKTKNSKKIKQIILFGSAARAEADRDSDVDIFIDVVKDEGKIEKEVKKVKEQFFNSVKYQKYWKLLNIKNEINVLVGKINNWKLKDSISGEGIVLYGKYSSGVKEGKNIVLFSWENIKPNSKRVLLNKKIFGFKHRGKFYPGVLDIYNGEKLSKGTIMFEMGYLQEVLQIFRKFKIKVKINKGKVWR